MNYLISNKFKVSHVVFAIFFSIASFIFFAPQYAYADDFRTDYTVDYYLSEQGGSIATEVNFKITITNLTSDLIIKTFTLQFPKTFQIGNIRASDDYRDLNPSVTEENGKHVISAEFSNFQAGLNSQNNLYLNFIQFNLFKINGNVWEVILPTVEKKDGTGDYTVHVHLPAGTRNKIAIAKPKPDHITVNEITWKNPSNRTIYAVFGDRQNYSLELRYHLTNPGLTKVYTDIAFPPDTPYQKIFIDSIQPPPASVSIDEDKNYLGRYYLNPKEEKTVYLKGGAVVYSNPRDDMIFPTEKALTFQKKYLLSTSVHWSLDEDQIPQNLPSVKDIYDFTVNRLTYNYSRVNSNISRLGASQALKYPDQAVCTEYSDVFVAIAREYGIYAREIQGYGFSNDPELRPLSVNSDILHSWSEFYDTSISQWHPIDPTWEDTSGIDYYHSFDLNHIVFSIHGKSSEYPYPAGSYKNNDTAKDINIFATSETFKENRKLQIVILPIQIPELSSDTYTLKAYLTNTGNTFVWNLPLSVKGDGLDFINPEVTIDEIAPYQKKEVSFQYRASAFRNESELEILSKGESLYKKRIPLTSSYFMIAKYLLILSGCILIVLLVVKYLKK